MDGKQKQRKSFSAAKISRGAVFSALGTALLLISYPFEMLDLTVACASAVIIWIMRIEYGSAFSLTVYAVTGVLSFILMPSNTGVISYIFVFGWYPVYKAMLETRVRKRALRMLLKALGVTAGFALMLAVFFGLFVGNMDFKTFAEEFSSFFSIKSDKTAVWLDEILLFGLNRLQWFFIGLYLLMAPIITAIYDLLLSKLTVIYMHRIRPALIKAKILK